MASTEIVSESTQKSPPPVFTRGSVVVGLLFGAGCWLLDTVFSAPLSLSGFFEALVPEGQILFLRVALSVTVAVAAATTSAYLIKELRYRDREEELFSQPSSDLLDGLAECAFVVNATGEILDANAAAATLFSWPVNMFMPMKVEWLVSEFIVDPDTDIQSFGELTAGMDKTPRKVDVVGKALSGRKFVAELICMPIRDLDDQFIVTVRQRDSEHPVPSEARH